MHEPAGYRDANDFVIAAAAESGGVLVPYCRVDPHDGAVAEADARSTPARAGSSSIRGPRASRWTSPRSATSSRSHTSAGCPC